MRTIVRKSEDPLVDFSVRITVDSEFIAFAEKRLRQLFAV